MTKNAVAILKSELYSVIETPTDLYAVYSSCNSRQRGKAGRKKGAITSTSKRTDNIRNLKKTFKRNRDLINCNFNGGSGNVLFITLTYADRKVKGKEGAKRVNHDVDLFIHNLKYATYNGNLKRATRYLKWSVTLEPQADGVWHLHCLFCWTDREKIYIPNHSLNNMWGQGFVKVNSVDNISNVGAYLTAYLTNVVIDPEKATKNSHWTRNYEHMIEKGGRLSMYPAGVKLCRHSRNLIKPAKYCADGDELKKNLILEGWHLNGSKNVKIDTKTIRKNPVTGKKESLIIEIKQFYFIRSRDVAEKFRLIRKIAKKSGKSVAEVLATAGLSSISEII